MAQSPSKAILHQLYQIIFLEDLPLPSSHLISSPRKNVLSARWWPSAPVSTCCSPSPRGCLLMWSTERRKSELCSHLARDTSDECWRQREHRVDSWITFVRCYFVGNIDGKKKGEPYFFRWWIHVCPFSHRINTHYKISVKQRCIKYRLSRILSTSSIYCGFHWAR